VVKPIGKKKLRRVRCISCSFGGTYGSGTRNGNGLAGQRGRGIRLRGLFEHVKRAQLVSMRKGRERPRNQQCEDGTEPGLEGILEAHCVSPPPAGRPRSVRCRESGVPENLTFRGSGVNGHLPRIRGQRADECVQFALTGGAAQPISHAIQRGAHHIVPQSGM